MNTAIIRLEENAIRFEDKSDDNVHKYDDKSDENVHKFDIKSDENIARSEDQNDEHFIDIHNKTEDSIPQTENKTADDKTNYNPILEFKTDYDLDMQNSDQQRYKNQPFKNPEIIIEEPEEGAINFIPK